MKKYKHVFGPEKYSMWQLTVLRTPVRSGCNFPSPELAACSCQFFKQYLNTEFGLEFPESLECEQHASLAYRQNVNLSSSLDVFKALPESAKQFINANRAALQEIKDAQPEETVFSKIRRHPPSMENPVVRDWVVAGERACMDARAFSEIDSKSFFLRLSVVERSFETAIKSLKLALRMHENISNEKLLRRRTDIESLLAHFESDRKYVEDFSAGLKTECDAVSTAVQTLENSRPLLS